MFTPLVLGALALALAWPVPKALSRAPQLRRTPLSALMLWQSVALGAVLAALGSLVSLVVGQVWHHEIDVGSAVVAGVAFGVGVMVIARLLTTGHRVGTSLRRIRHTHRAQVELVSRRADGRLRVLDHEVPVAYCIPAWGHSRIVVSETTLARLTAEELDAVVAHERSHLRARHDLVLEAFTVMSDAFPRLPSTRAAQREVQLLVEVLADRSARAMVGARPMLSALSTLAGAPAPAASLSTATSGLAVRAQLLADARRRPLQATVVLAAAVGVLALPTMLVVVPWLQDLG